MDVALQNTANLIVQIIAYVIWLIIAVVYGGRRILEFFGYKPRGNEESGVVKALIRSVNNTGEMIESSGAKLDKVVESLDNVIRKIDGIVQNIQNSQESR